MRITFLLAILFLFSETASAWGKYGHEQINHAAIKLLKDGAPADARPLIDCWVDQNADVLVRLAITPDFDWKAIDMQNTPPELKHKKMEDDAVEHDNHFFEYNAFCSETVLPQNCKIPMTQNNYDLAVKQLEPLLSTRASIVAKIDPTKTLKDPKNPTDLETLRHGTAPWRIVELYNLGVKALAQGDTKFALIYLGAMGHYVGDMSQPFHATLNFDGQASVPPANGVHHTYEECILEMQALTTNSQWDAQTLLYSDFNSTEPAVLASADDSNGKTISALSGGSSIPTVMSLIQSGEAYVDPIASAFANELAKYLQNPPSPSRLQSVGSIKKISTSKTSDQPKKGVRTPKKKPPTPPQPNTNSVNVPPYKIARASAEQKPVSIPDGFCKVFKDFQIDDPRTSQSNPKVTVLLTAEERMGLSAVLLARLWLGAYYDAKKQNPDTLKVCATFKAIDFEKELLPDVINQYPQLTPINDAEKLQITDTTKLRTPASKKDKFSPNTKP